MPDIARTIKSPVSWQAKAAKNAKAELGQRAATLLESFDLTDSQLVDVLLSPATPAWVGSHRRAG